MSGRIYQLKIELKGTTPAIWRRIQVPESYSFWDLHVAIQDAMGWLDYHLHVFLVRRKHARKPTLIGIPNDDPFPVEPETLAGWEIPINSYFQDVGFTVDYAYDFGDGWEHLVMLEGILLKEMGQRYPKCIDGALACPPEDCGGVHGYYQLLETLSDPDSETYEDMLEWLGEKYDASEFRPEGIKFDNPRKRWKLAFSHTL